MLVLFLLQAAAAQAPPDIELDIRASARRVRIEQQGEASLEVRASPEGEKVVRVEAPEGRRTLRNVEVRVRAEARIADPLNPQASLAGEATADPSENEGEPETPRPE